MSEEYWWSLPFLNMIYSNKMHQCWWSFLHQNIQNSRPTRLGKNLWRPLFRKKKTNKQKTKQKNKKNVFQKSLVITPSKLVQKMEKPPCSLQSHWECYGGIFVMLILTRYKPTFATLTLKFPIEYNVPLFQQP